jgi:hypothetical protein
MKSMKRKGFYHVRGLTPGPRWHFAKVYLEVTPAPDDTITIADDAFASREYPDAPEVAYYKAEAIAGVRDALADLPTPRPRYRVTLTEIHDAPIDTAPGDVRVAAARAFQAAFATND